MGMPLEGVCLAGLETGLFVEAVVVVVGSSAILLVVLLEDSGGIVGLELGAFVGIIGFATGDAASSFFPSVPDEFGWL